MTSLLIDTHAHLDYTPAAEIAGVVSRAAKAGVGRIITVGTDIKTSRRSIEIASATSGIYASVGIHPHEAANTDDVAIEEIRQLASDENVVALGETGLDYYRMLAPRADQIEAFRRQIDLAIDLDMPLIVHCRDAYEDLVKELARSRPKRLVIHCFSGGPVEAARLVDLGAYISFSGTVTFANAPDIRRAAAEVPLDRLLVETDSPYLTPHPHRGRPNEPAYVKLVAEKVAEVNGVGFQEIVKSAGAAADSVFGPRLGHGRLFNL